MIVLDWPPTVNHYYTVARGRKILSKQGRQYKKDAIFHMMQQRVAKLTYDCFAVSIDAYPPDKRKRDLDNLLKPILDALTAYGAITDDSAINHLTITRHPKENALGKIVVYVHNGA